MKLPSDRNWPAGKPRNCSVWGYMRASRACSAAIGAGAASPAFMPVCERVDTGSCKHGGRISRITGCTVRRPALLLARPRSCPVRILTMSSLLQRLVLASALLSLPALADSARVQPWSLPAPPGSAQPNLALAGGDLLLSWLEPQGGMQRLRFARDRGQGFDAPRDIARGADWFVNWADFPALTALPDGSLAAHFLQKSAQAPYAYDVRLVRSRDGVEWSEPVTVHDDGTLTEHGFVSLWAWSDDSLAVAWLDGRQTGGGHEHGGHGGAMGLRGAVFGAEGKREEWQLDARTCDCCQTDVAVSAGGPVLVYRDRSDEEIRDIAVTRYRDGAWSAPRVVHADRWFMPACPVNGPAVAAAGRDVYVAWYTAAQDTPALLLAHSSDDTQTFAEPRRLDAGSTVHGRVDVAVDAQNVVVSWLTENPREQTLWLARYPRDLAAESERIEVARMARGRGTGFPRMQLRDGVAHLAWTDVVDGKPRLRGARVSFDAPAEPLAGR